MIINDKYIVNDNLLYKKGEELKKKEQKQRKLLRTSLIIEI